MDTVMTEKLRMRIFSDRELLTMLLSSIHDAEKENSKFDNPKTLAECLKINEGYRRVREYLPTEKVDHKAYIRTYKELKQIDFLSIAEDLIKLDSLGNLATSKG